MITFPRYESYQDSKVELAGKIPSSLDRLSRLNIFSLVKKDRSIASLLEMKTGYPVVGSGGKACVQPESK